MENLQRATADEVEWSLERILASKYFSSSPTMGKFLTYVVNEKLGGRESNLKAYTIAVDALGKNEDFDSQTDPAVRVLAGRVRSSLAEYYATMGAEDPVEISIPTGSYRPEFTPSNVVPFTKRESTSSEALADSATENIDDRHVSNNFVKKILLALMALMFAIGVYLAANWYWSEKSPPLVEHSDNANIVVLMHQNLYGRGNLNASSRAGSVFQMMKVALSRNDVLAVISPVVQDEEAAATSPDPVPSTVNADFIVGGFLQKNGGANSISIELLNARTRRLVWGRSYVLGEDAAEISNQIVRELNTQIFGASIKALEGRNPESLTARQLFVLATWVPGAAKNSLEWERERIQLARLALEKDPDFGPAYSVLSDKLAYLAAVDGPSNKPEAREEANKSALRALELDPGNANTVFNVAQHYWHAGDLDAAIRSQKRVLELDPSHGFARFFSTVIPYTCNAAPDDVVNAAIAFDRSLGADNPIRWVTLTWIGWLRLNREEFDLALDAEERAAQIFQIPYTVMRHAAILNQLERADDAAKLLLAQRSNWPNISPNHFASVTMPRLCQQRSDSGKMIGYYQSLAAAMDTRLSK